MKEHYQAGQLTEEVSVIRKTRAADGAGGYTEQEQTQGPHYAYIRALGGQERLANAQVNAFGDCLFVFNRDVSILPTDVLLYAGLRYNVTALKPFGKSAFREVEATSGDVT